MLKVIKQAIPIKCQNNNLVGDHCFNATEFTSGFTNVFVVCKLNGFHWLKFAAYMCQKPKAWFPYSR